MEERTPQAAEPSKLKKILKEWIIPFGIEILVVLLLLKFAFFLTRVPSGSMLPTIQEHSILFATHMYAPEKTVQRGDILVFESDELGEILIKRVIGLPGDEVTLDHGELYINGERYEEPYVVYDENFSGTWNVPEGSYLFFGDNRAGSWDARKWSEPYIPEDKLIGEARFTLWPLSNFGFLE